MYYILKFACDTKETGSEFPQVQKMKNGYDYEASDSIRALAKSRDKFPAFQPNLDSFQLHSKAKLTDLLSNSLTGSFGMLISSKLKNIIEKHTIVPHKFYPAKVSFKKSLIENYYWMHIISDLTNCIDYNKSNFYIYKDYSINLGNISITSKEDLIQKKEQLKKNNPKHTITIWSETLIFNDSFDRDLDLFEIGLFDANYYISQRLKQAILEAKITGCDISIAQNLIIEKA